MSCLKGIGLACDGGDIPLGFDKEIVNKSFSNAIKLNWLGNELFADVLLLFSFFAFFFGEFGAFGGDFVLNFFWIYKKITI